MMNNDLYRRYKHDEKPTVATIPVGFWRTAQKAKIIDGIEWRSYGYGVMQYEMVAELPGRVAVWCNYKRSTYSASIHGRTIGNRYHSETAAMKAVAKVVKK